MRMVRKVLLARSSPRAISLRTDIGLIARIVATSFTENARRRTATVGLGITRGMLIGPNVSPRAILTLRL
jgi:hypothetical protein